MFGFLARPRGSNELVHQLVAMKCRTVGNEHDETLQRDLAHVEKEAGAAIQEPELLAVVEEMAELMMRGVDLERYSDRKNPAIFLYNLMSMPHHRAQRLFARVAGLRDEQLRPLVCPDTSRCEVALTLQVYEVDYTLVREDPRCRQAFEQAMRQTIALDAGPGVDEEHIEVTLWGDGYLDFVVTPPTGVMPDHVLQALSRCTVEVLSERLVLCLESCQLSPEHDVRKGTPFVNQIQMTAHLSSRRSEAISKVCIHSAWLEQNTREWDAASGGKLTGAAKGYKEQMKEDEEIVRRYFDLMGFDDQPTTITE